MTNVYDDPYKKKKKSVFLTHFYDRMIPNTCYTEHMIFSFTERIISLLISTHRIK